MTGTTESAPPLVSTAGIATGKASRYLQQLCKHFAHRIPATCTPEAGRIEFELGPCILAAADGRLALRVEAADEPALARLEQVVASHLERFAFREELKVEWQRAG